uniref:Uncharacterized protein n=1 Tax=Micrurus carvalhoi TaxID=3147026 RepID=A0A2H6N8R7_9SAUR
MWHAVAASCSHMKVVICDLPTSQAKWKAGSLNRDSFNDHMFHLMSTINMVVKSGPVTIHFMTSPTYNRNSSPNCDCKVRTTYRSKILQSSGGQNLKAFSDSLLPLLRS